MTLVGFQSSSWVTARRLIFMLVASTTLALLGCEQGAVPNTLRHFKFAGPTMGTTYHVQIVAPGNIDAQGLEKMVVEELGRLSRVFSTYDTDSDLSRLNEGSSAVKIEISKELANVLISAQAVGKASDGNFDVTVGPLVDLWGFGPSENPPFSAVETQLPSLLKSVGNHLFVVDEKDNSFIKKHADLKIDLSALAKGYAVDAVYGLLKAEGVDNLLVEIGGEVKASGRKRNGESWRTGLEKPLAGQRAVGWVVSLDERAVASSGDYRHYFEHDGVRYSHLINPKTGRPIKYRNVSVSVVHAQAMVADAWATAFAVLGPVGGLRIAEEQHIAVQFVVGEQVFRSSAFEQLPVEAF